MPSFQKYHLNGNRAIAALEGMVVEFWLFDGNNVSDNDTFLFTDFVL